MTMYLLGSILWGGGGCFKNIFSISYMYNTKSDHFSCKIRGTFMEIGNQMPNHKIETYRELIYEDGSILVDFNFYQNYRQRYIVIPITTVRGPLYLLYL